MKKNIKIMSAVLAGVVSLFSCSEDALFEETQSKDIAGNMTFVASYENWDVDTRASISDGNNIVWNEGDKISIFSPSADGQTTKNNQFALSLGDGTTRGTFTGTCTSGSHYYAIYPYSEENSLVSSADKKYVIHWQGQQQIAVKGSFPLNTPMAAYAAVPEGSDKEVSLEFKNILGFVKVTTNYKCKAITLTCKTGQAVACEYLYMTESNGVPVLTSVDRLSSSVTLVGKDGAILEAGTYYIAVLPGSVSGGFDLTFTSAYGNKTLTKSTTQDVTFARGNILNLGEIVLTPQFVGLSGQGSATDPFLISNYYELCYMRDLINEGNSPYYASYYKQTQDIDGGGATFTPIGTVSGSAPHRFNGTYDGGGHTIKNLKTTTASASNQKFYYSEMNSSMSKITECYTTALFAYTLDATIKNLTVENLDLSGLTGGNDETCYVKSSLIGIAYGSSDSSKKTCIENVTVKSKDAQTVSGSCSYYIYGGLVAVSLTNLEITNCENYTWIDDASDIAPHITIGGIVGEVQSDQYRAHININKCRNHGNLKVEYPSDATDLRNAQIGGILGIGFESAGYCTDIITNIKNCVNFGDLTAKLQKAYMSCLGGIVGHMDSDGYNSDVPYIRNCINNGCVYISEKKSTDYQYCGGIVGFIYDNDTHIEYCANTGRTIRNTNGFVHLGGIVGGDNGILTHCYNYNDTNRVGGSKNNSGETTNIGNCITFMNANADNTSGFCRWKYAESTTEPESQLDLDF